MIDSRHRSLLLFGILPGPLLVVFLGTQSAYWAGTISANWLPSYLALLVGVALGTFCMASYPMVSSHRKLALLTIGVPVLLVLLWWCGLMTSCANGDCL